MTDEIQPTPLVTEVDPEIARSANSDELAVMELITRSEYIDERYRVWFVVDVQSFRFECAHDTKYESDWMRWMLAKAILRMKENYFG